MSENGAMSKYVVQVMTNENERVWQDVATVEVPPRTKRKTIIEKAHEEAGILEANAGGKVVRVLDEESARGMAVALVAGPERLVVG